jgi:hypothetical protein
MSSNPVPPAPQSSAGGSTVPGPPRRRWWLFGCGGLLALAAIIVTTVALTLWWIQRPIKPVVLSAAEKQAVDDKLSRFGEAATNRPLGGSTRDAVLKPAQDIPYTPGSRELRLSERELNGLLNANTEFGTTVRLELGRDTINAYLVVPVPEDFPIGGGKMFRARGRFLVSLNNDEKPYAILEDVTVLGVSLPKAWLGGLKGENLIAEAVGERNGSPIFRGVKSLRIVPGALVLEVEE